ncbi:MAG: BREX-3 system P-loop-containing protein BrxF [Chloroflexi bacterium]|nr:BREX-3 system P-loop-containing protein BrxF [Chloroflexota bacterium]
MLDYNAGTRVSPVPESRPVFGFLNQSMASEVVHTISAAVDQLLRDPGYYACLVLVHYDVTHLASQGSAVLATYRWPHLSVGQELSEALLQEQPSRYPTAASKWLTDRVSSLSPGPVQVTAIDLLFGPALDLDPLILFRQASRTTRLVILWPGTYLNGVLSYAVPEHGHYRTWPKPDIQITTLQ